MLPLTERRRLAGPPEVTTTHHLGGNVMSSLKSISGALIATLIVACAAVIGLSQEFRGSITGRVVDNSGAAVANANVTVTNAATNVSTSTATNGDGDYTALYLTPGSYSVTVEAAGFKKSTRQNIEV